ncbi:MAG: diguanylate cyclase, partial [Povalibacter sp.]
MARDPKQATEAIPLPMQTVPFASHGPNTRRPKVDFDVLLTKAAVDFQNPPADNADAVIGSNLEALREAVGLDNFFVVRFNAQHDGISHVVGASSLFATFNPGVLSGEQLATMPYVRDRLEHLRVIEMRDTTQPRRELAAEGTRFASVQVGAVLLSGFAVRGRIQGFIAMCSTHPRESWDANLHLMLKLLASSYASGLERDHLRTHFEDLEERSELALYGANDGLWDFDLEKKTTYFSPRWKSMLGYSDEEIEPLTDWQQLVHPEDLPRVQTALREHLAGKESLFESVHRLKHHDGLWLWVVSRAKARVDAHGRTRRIVGVDLDVTERKLYEEALFREKESAQITLQSIGDGVITTDSNCRIEYLNPVAEQLTGWRLEHAQGRVVDEIFRSFHEETCEPLENPLAVAIRRTRAIKSVRPTLLIRRDGNELYIESCASPIRDGSGVICGGVLVFHDVSESRELNRKLSYHASHDILTGLVNRREFESRLERALKSARARESSYALCHIDLDQFKIINDNCGHSAGDALLGQVGALLKSKIRWRDTVARLGGDEFGVLLESCSIEEAIRNAEALREAIRNYKFVWEERTFRLGASVGVVPLSPENEDVASL